MCWSLTETTGRRAKSAKNNRKICNARCRNFDRSSMGGCGVGFYAFLKINKNQTQNWTNNRKNSSKNHCKFEINLKLSFKPTVSKLLLSSTVGCFATNQSSNTLCSSADSCRLWSIGSSSANFYALEVYFGFRSKEPFFVPPLHYYYSCVHANAFFFAVEKPTSNKYAYEREEKKICVCVWKMHHAKKKIKKKYRIYMKRSCRYAIDDRRLPLTVGRRPFSKWLKSG